MTYVNTVHVEIRNVRFRSLNFVADHGSILRSLSVKVSENTSTFKSENLRRLRNFRSTMSRIHFIGNDRTIVAHGENTEVVKTLNRKSSYCIGVRKNCHRKIDSKIYDRHNSVFYPSMLFSSGFECVSLRIVFRT